MGEQRRFGSLLSELEYNDYVALVCSTDAEWSRRRPRLKDPDEYAFQPFHEAHERLTRDCWDYRKAVDGNYRNFLKANEGNDVKADKPNWRLAPYLFNPICFFPFGHPDNQAIILLDDFDPVQFLTEVCKTTVEEVVLAFCPRLSSLGAEHGKDGFAELHELLLEGGEPRVPREDPDPDRRGIWYPAEHKCQEDAPLMAFTKYKLGGLGAVGHGLMFQHAVYKAMVDRILQIRAMLYSALQDDGTVGGLIWKEDIDTARVVFLDMQGSEEIGTLIFCQNYSVALAYVAGLRGLTFGDVYRADARVLRLLNESKAHRAVVCWSRQLRQGLDPKSPPSGDARLLSDNHAFKWTQTALSISRSEGQRPKHTNCRGYVEASAEFQLCPGHRGDVKDLAVSSQEQQAADPDEVPKIGTGYHLYPVGTGDLIVMYGEGGEAGREGGERLLSLRSLLSLVGSNLRRFGYKKLPKDPGRHVVDITTSLAVPVPAVLDEDGQDIVCPRVGKDHFAPFGEMLPKLEASLCMSRGSVEDGDPGAPRPAGLSLADLRRGTKRLGVPTSLRRTIQYMYQDFAATIGNARVFDTILDLYDTFATLHYVLTKYLGPIRADELKTSGNSWPSAIDEGRAEQLAMLVDATHNALIHRVLKAHPEAPVRDIAIDFRGGLNQLLLAADASVKCGLGILRKYAPAAVDPKERLVGAPTRISFLPGASCVSLNLADANFPKLAYFEVGVPHVLHPASYLDYLHESFHLVFNTIRDTSDGHGVDTEAEKAFGITGPVMLDRASEVFAGLLGHIFVFGRDTKAYLYHNLCGYANSLISLGTDDRDSMARLVELLIRLFLITDAIPDGDNGPESWTPDYRARDDDTNAALGRFGKMVEQVGFLCTRYDDFWNGPKGDLVRAYCHNQFQAIHAKTSPLMPGLWREAMGVYQRFAEQELRVDGRKNLDISDIDKDVEDAFQRGSPLIRCLYSLDLASGKSIGSDGAPGPEDRGLDALTVICRLLYRYVSRILEAEGKQVHLHRDSEGNVQYPRGDSDPPWNDFQIEQGAAAMFCPVPRARRERLRKQIVIFKTCWDISSNLRARRLWWMVRDNWADCERYIGR